MVELVTRMSSWCRFSFLCLQLHWRLLNVTSGQVLTPATIISRLTPPLSCQLVTGQGRRALRSSRNRFNKNGVGFPGWKLRMTWFNMNVKLLVSLVMTLGLTRALEIESLAVPPVLVSGDSAVMSCYYTLPDTRLPELDIKWYHGASPSPFMVSIYSVLVLLTL